MLQIGLIVMPLSHFKNEGVMIVTVKNPDVHGELAQHLPSVCHNHQ